MGQHQWGFVLRPEKWRNKHVEPQNWSWESIGWAQRRVRVWGWIKGKYADYLYDNDAEVAIYGVWKNGRQVDPLGHDKL